MTKTTKRRLAGAMGLACLFVTAWGCDTSVESFGEPSGVRFTLIQLEPAQAAALGGDACIPEDPCAEASGRGYLQGFKCDLDYRWVSDPSISCEDALAACEAHAAEFPGHSYLCEWNGQQIFAEEVEAGACDDEGPALEPCDEPDEPDSCEPCSGAEGLGFYYGDLCGIDGGTIQTADISCQDALDNCVLNDTLNPTHSIYCEWNGVEIYRNEVEADACVSEYGPAHEGCDDPGDPGTCDPEDPCATAEGVGIYYFDFCGMLGGSGFTAGITCQEALDNCLLNDGANPAHSIYCEWNDIELYRNEVEADACVPEYGPASVCADPDCVGADPCTGTSGMGFGFVSVGCQFPGEVLPPLGSSDDGISCGDAYTACLDAAAANPGSSINCRWNDRTLVYQEAIPGECADFGPVSPSCEP